MQGNTLADKFVNLKWWQVALLSIAVSLIGGLSSGKPNRKERAVYDRELKQAPWAPPGWVFGPAWIINNTFILLALQQLLRHRQVSGRKRLLGIQAVIWVIFFSFGYIYFRRKSPVLAAAWTISDAVLAITSFVLANRSDKKLALHYLPLVLWTSYASTLAGYQAINNPDPVLHIEAPIEVIGS